MLELLIGLQTNKQTCIADGAYFIVQAIMYIANRI